MSAFTVNFSFAVYLLSLFSYGAGYISRKRVSLWFGCSFIISAFIAQAIYLGWRWTTGGYAPMSNMYESLLLMIWFVSFLYLWFLFLSPLYKEEVNPVRAHPELENGEPMDENAQAQSHPSSNSLNFPLLGLGFWVALFCLLLLGIASLNDRSIQALMPALQSNWLLFHVTTTLVGYSAVALSFLLAGVYLICFRKKPQEEKPRAYDGLIERATTLGFLFLTIGIILGSVWANSAWGSYWSWDPKETWSLITWFFYAVALHLRKTRNWRDEKFAWLSLFGFVLVLFTYFGVNYLISGLHSYA